MRQMVTPSTASCTMTPSLEFSYAAKITFYGLLCSSIAAEVEAKTKSHGHCWQSDQNRQPNLLPKYAETEGHSKE